jgi:hypothetical protein
VSKTWRGIWNEEERSAFRKKLVGIELREVERKLEWEELERKMREAIREVKIDLSDRGERKRG